MKNKFIKLLSTIAVACTFSCSNGDSPKTYTVSFDTDSTTVIESQIVEENGLITKPSDPEKEGYSFVEWQYNEVAWNFNEDRVVSDMTLKAIYSENPYGYSATFTVDDHCSVVVYNTQDTTQEGTATTTAYSRDGDSGELLHDGNGQVNFKVVCDDGYTVDEVNVTPNDNFNNNKLISSEDHLYRITKITGDIEVNITTKIDEGAIEAYKATFVIEGGNASITVYTTNKLNAVAEEGVSSTYSRDKDTGEYTNNSDSAQVNFSVAPESGYKVSSVTATEGAYNKIKNVSTDFSIENAYSITKVNKDIEITIVLEAI